MWHDQKIDKAAVQLQQIEELMYCVLIILKHDSSSPLDAPVGPSVVVEPPQDQLESFGCNNSKASHLSLQERENTMIFLILFLFYF